MPTATTITAPVTKLVQFESTEKKMSPLLITATMSAPSSAPGTVPEPPLTAVPPMIAAAITCSSKPPPTVGSAPWK